MSIEVVIPSEPASTSATTVIHPVLHVGTHDVDAGVLQYPREPTGYEREREAFNAQRGELLQRFAGQFVAIYQGRVVDHDESQRELSRRFFAQHPDAPVYIGFVGPRRVVRIPTPLVHRRTSG